MNIGKRTLLVSGAAAGLARVLPNIAEASPRVLMPKYCWDEFHKAVPWYVSKSMPDPDIIWIGPWRDKAAMNTLMNFIDGMHMPIETHHGADMSRLLLTNTLPAPRAFAGMFRLMDRFMASLGVPQADALELTLVSSAISPPPYRFPVSSIGHGMHQLCLDMQSRPNPKSGAVP